MISSHRGFTLIQPFIYKKQSYEVPKKLSATFHLKKLLIRLRNTGLYYKDIHERYGNTSYYNGLINNVYHLISLSYNVKSINNILLFKWLYMIKKHFKFNLNRVPMFTILDNNPFSKIIYEVLEHDPVILPFAINLYVFDRAQFIYELEKIFRYYFILLYILAVNRVYKEYDSNPYSSALIYDDLEQKVFDTNYLINLFKEHFMSLIQSKKDSDTQTPYIVSLLLELFTLYLKELIKRILNQKLAPDIAAVDFLITDLRNMDLYTSTREDFKRVLTSIVNYLYAYYSGNIEQEMSAHIKMILENINFIFTNFLYNTIYGITTIEKIVVDPAKNRTKRRIIYTIKYLNSDILQSVIATFLLNKVIELSNLSLLFRARDFSYTGTTKTPSTIIIDSVSYYTECPSFHIYGYLLDIGKVRYFKYPINYLFFSAIPISKVFKPKYLHNTFYAFSFVPIRPDLLYNDIEDLLIREHRFDIDDFRKLLESTEKEYISLETFFEKTHGSHFICFFLFSNLILFYVILHKLLSEGLAIELKQRDINSYTSLYESEFSKSDERRKIIFLYTLLGWVLGKADSGYIPDVVKKYYSKFVTLLWLIDKYYLIMPEEAIDEFLRINNSYYNKKYRSIFSGGPNFSKNKYLSSLLLNKKYSNIVDVLFKEYISLGEDKFRRFINRRITLPSLYLLDPSAIFEFLGRSLKFLPSFFPKDIFVSEKDVEDFYKSVKQSFSKIYEELKRNNINAGYFVAFLLVFLHELIRSYQKADRIGFLLDPKLFIVLSPFIGENDPTTLTKVIRLVSLHYNSLVFSYGDKILFIVNSSYVKIFEGIVKRALAEMDERNILDYVLKRFTYHTVHRIFVCDAISLYLFAKKGLKININPNIDIKSYLETSKYLELVREYKRDSPYILLGVNFVKFMDHAFSVVSSSGDVNLLQISQKAYEIYNNIKKVLEKVK